MKQIIKKLIQLQNYDDQIRTAFEKKNNIPIKIKQIEDKLKKREREIEEKKRSLSELKKQSRAIEREIQDLEIKILKSNEKLLQIKSNKEYTAALKEIDDLKYMKTSTEDKALDIMESIEEKEKRISELEKMLKSEKEDCDKTKKNILKEAEELEKEIDLLKKERAACENKVDQELLERYNFLKERKDGQAVSSVINGVCQTCHMGIPPQKFIELIKCETLMTCPNCNRIIYWGEDDQLSSITIRD